MAWPRKLEVSLITAGGLLLSVYLVPTLYGAALSRLAIARFHSASSSKTLWDKSRIRAYERTLSLSFDPPVAVLHVPRIGLEVPVLEGVSDLVLNRGVGHVPGTALPGKAGNFVIAGHRDGFFRGLKDVVPGDLIDVERPSQPGSGRNGQSDHYMIRKVKVVLPSDVSVLSQTSGSSLTLITCYPFYFVGSAPRRYVVQATLLSLTQSTSQPY